MFTPSWKPLRLSFDLDQRVEQLFTELIHKPWGSHVRANSWQPAIDVFETESAYVLVADLPGVRAEDIELHIEANVVTIRGCRESVNVTQTALNLSVERIQGQFSRHFELTQPVNAEGIESHFENGIYHAKLPKQPAHPPGNV